MIGLGTVPVALSVPVTEIVEPFGILTTWPGTTVRVVPEGTPRLEDSSTGRPAKFQVRSPGSVPEVM